MTARSQGKYTLEAMKKMAIIASTADGLVIEGNGFKVSSLTGSPDMVLFACEKIKELTERLEIEQEQFKQIRLHTQDGDLACICASHETAIKELLSSLF